MTYEINLLVIAQIITNY